MKWVTALHIGQWADRIGSRVALSEIVSALVRASATGTDEFRFPTGDSAQIPGYDGQLTSSGAPPYVPAGTSVWEFGVSEDYYNKANDDYSERSKKPGAVTPANTTFVFVTPRTWKRANPSSHEWEKEKRAEGVWKDVKVIDGVALEDWLDRNPAVAARIARRTLRLVTESGARSSDEYWEEYAAGFKTAITEKALLCDREEQAKELLSRLGGGPQEIPWRADSPDEVVAFALAAVRSAEDELRKFLEARILVLDTAEAARQLARQPNMIYIPRASALPLSGLLAMHNPSIVPFGRDSPRLNVSTLRRPSTRALAAAIESMGYGSDDAHQLARSCGRSVTILQRRIPGGHAGVPEWADGTRSLIPAFLAGGWDATSEGDKEILSLLANGESYEVYEENLRPLLKLQDPPLDRESNVWQIRAPVGAFVHLGHMIGARDIDNFSRAVITIFSKIDPPAGQQDGEENILAVTARSSRRHSEWLRDGVATTLLQMSVLHEQAGLIIDGTTPPVFVENVIAGLPQLMADHRLIASLKSQLPLLMEAAPRPLLGALEHLLEGDGEAVRPMFQAGGLFSKTSPHTYVLWALEPLAWDPEYLSQVAGILAKMARVDPGGDTTNRPINSLREIFLSWNPNTNATLTHRLAVLDQLLAAEPNVGWELLVKLFPEAHEVSHPNQQPRHREAGASEREPLTWPLILEAQRRFVERALDVVGNHFGRWRTIIEAMSRFPPELRERVYTLLGDLIATAEPAWRVSLWKILLHEVNKHRSFADAEWSLKEPDLNRLDALLEALEPTDRLERHSWLFDSDHPDVPGRSMEDPLHAVNDARAAAMAEIRATGGDTAVLELASRVQHPHFVAFAIAGSVNDAAAIDALIDSSLGRSERLNHFAVALSGRAQEKCPDDWRARMIARAASGNWDYNQLASLFLAWPDVPATWDFVASFGAQVDESYWSRKMPWRLRGTSEEAERAAKHYLAVGRPVAGLEATASHVAHISLPLIFELLDGVIVDLNSKKVTPSNLFDYRVGEIFKRLAKRSDTPAVELAKREYAYLPLLRHEVSNLALHQIMAGEPAFYFSVICDVFRKASEEPTEPDEDRRARANAGYQLLRSFHVVPGIVGNDIDFDKLAAWTTEVRRLAVAGDRVRVTDQYIGHVLAHAPPDPKDNGWPHAAVRQLIESIASEDIETGIRIERFNMRGVWSKALLEGGKQERDFATQARTWAKTVTAYPRTSSMLRTIAKEWDAFADAEDVRARQDEMKYQ